MNKASVARCCVINDCILRNHLFSWAKNFMVFGKTACSWAFDTVALTFLCTFTLFIFLLTLRFVLWLNHLKCFHSIIERKWFFHFHPKCNSFWKNSSYSLLSGCRNKKICMHVFLWQYGLDFHHAQPGYVMMAKWLPTTEASMIPEYANQYLGKEICIEMFNLQDCWCIFIVGEERVATGISGLYVKFNDGLRCISSQYNLTIIWHSHSTDFIYRVQWSSVKKSSTIAIIRC